MYFNHSAKLEFITYFLTSASSFEIITALFKIEAFPEGRKLIEKIKETLKNKFISEEDILITRERHRQHLIQCIDHLKKFAEKNGWTYEFAINKLLENAK